MTEFEVQVGRCLKVKVADDSFRTALIIAQTKFDEQYSSGGMTLSAKVVPSNCPTIAIVNDKGRPFVARIVKKGDNYGLGFGLVYGEGKDAINWDGKPKDEELLRPMIEFYDASYDFDHYGQFVSRYYVSTFMEGGRSGLDLMGYEPEWKIDAGTIDLVRHWVRNQLPEEVWNKKDTIF